jgi:hypothetical protein
VFFKAFRNSLLPNGPTGNKAPVEDAAFFSFLVLLPCATGLAFEGDGDAITDIPVATSFSAGALDILEHEETHYNNMIKRSRWAMDAALESVDSTDVPI